MTLRETLSIFDGRLRRRDWWLYTIVSSLVWVALASLIAMATSGMTHGSGYYLSATIGDPVQQVLVAAAVYAPVVFVQTVLAARRAHDRNQGAGLVILLTLVTAVMSFTPDLAIVGRLADNGAVWAWLLFGVGTLAKAGSLYLLIVLGFLDGTPGPNRFGPSPKALSEGRPAFMAPGGLD